MAFNRRPLRNITHEDQEAYARDGAVCLRRVFNPDWIDTLLPIARRVVVDKEDFGLLPNVPNSWLARKIPECRELAFNSPLGEACGRAMGSKQIRFFLDQFFAKPPNSQAKTVWHSDRGGWPVRGTMVPSFWMPLTPIANENCLEVIAETHRNDVVYWNMTANSRQMIKPDDRLNVPDGEDVRNNPDFRFLTWEMEPGDALLVHPWCLHYSSGNPTDDWRIAISIRVFGDDIVWEPRPECVNIAGISLDEMIPGEKPQGPLLPLIWSEDGYKDDTESYPKGFATTWSEGARERLARESAKRKSYEQEVKERGGPSAVPPLSRAS